MKAKKICVTFMTLIFSTVVHAQYSDQLGKLLIKNFTDTPKDWVALKYPTDNFGVGTMYRGKRLDGDFLCATQTCLGLSSLGDLENSGFIAHGKGGSVSLDSTQKSSAVVDGLIPKLFQVLKVAVGFNRSGVDVTSLTFTSAEVRLLNYDPAVKRINSLDDNSGVKKAFNRGALRVATGDIVINDLVACVTINKQTNANLDLELDKVATSQKPSQASASASKPGASTSQNKATTAAGMATCPQKVAANAPAGGAPAASAATAGSGTNSAVSTTQQATPAQPAASTQPTPGANSGGTPDPSAVGTLNIGVTSLGDGKYELRCTLPVVAAVLIQKQPRQGELSKVKGWGRWSPAIDTSVP